MPRQDASSLRAISDAFQFGFSEQLHGGVPGFKLFPSLSQAMKGATHARLGDVVGHSPFAFPW